MKKEEKSSTRMRRWNYKPSNRYNNISFQSTSKNNEELILCKNCANLNLNEQMKNSNSCKKINSMKHVNVNHKKSQITAISNYYYNFTKLGPIQRSHYVKNNVYNLISHKENTLKLCQLNTLKIDIISRDYQKDQIKYLNGNNVEKREFDIITKNAIITKLNPLQLKNPKLMLNFLKNYLNIKK